MATAVEVTSKLRVELANWISLYLAGEVDTDRFVSWFVPATWEAERTEPELADAIHEVELLLAEARHRTAEDLKARFTDLLTRLSPPPPFTVSAAASRNTDVTASVAV